MRPTIIEFFNHSVEKFADNPFLWEKIDTQFEPITYTETKAQTHLIAAGLIDLGVQTGDKIALLSEGRNAWIIGELAILHIGAVNVPLSIKLEECNDLIFRVLHSEAKYILVSGGQLKKIRAITDAIPQVEKIIVIDPQKEYQSREMPLDDLLKTGKKLLEEQPDIVLKRSLAIKPDDIANISYTSGTTADPKGILLTHRNYTANTEQAMSLMTIPPSYRTLIILPLDHCFAHVAGFYSFMAYGAGVGTVQTGKTGFETLKNIPLNIKELKPSILLSVPSLAKNFKKNIESSIKSQGILVQKLFNWAMKLSYSYNKEGFNKGRGLQILKKPLISLFDKILFAKIREAFGGELQYFIGGGALLDIELQRFFYAVGIPMFQGYGLSEATPIISSNSLPRHKLGSSGYLVNNMELKICDLEGKELPNFEKGEIVIKGENVMKGYYKNEKATAKTIIDGWLHTGDMGYMDNDGFLYVVGRFKSLLIANDGEKFSPEGIEESLADNSNYIEQVVLHNNQNPFTIALLVPNKEALKQYIKEKHPHLEWASEEAKQVVLKKIQKEIDEYKKGGRLEGMFPERWLPTAVAVINEPFTEQNGLMNSTMKIVRSKVEHRYAEKIDFIYRSSEGKNIVNAMNIKEFFQK